MEESKNDPKNQNDEDIQDTEPTPEKFSESSEDNKDSNNEPLEVTEVSEDSNFLTKYSNFILAGVISIVILGIFIYAFTTSTSESSAVLSEATVSSADETAASQSNSQYNSNLLLIILSLITLISISISFWLYYWRKLIIADKEIMVPETFESNIKSLNKVANNNSLNIQSTLDKHTAALNSSSKMSNEVNDEISRISEVITHLQNALEKKDEEMERFKKGYDADIYHKF